MDSFFKWLFSN